VALGALLSAVPGARADLTTYGYGNARLGTNFHAVTISPTNVARLGLAWNTNVGGAVTDQPLIVDRVRVGGRVRDLALVGTEHGQVVALDANSGAIVWRHSVGSRTIKSDCAVSPDSIFGVTGTMAIDRSADRVYTIDVNGRVWAFRLDTGKLVNGWPIATRSAAGDFVWGALALSRGWLYVPVASLCDVGYSHGGVVAVNVRHPKQTLSWRTVSGAGPFGGGVWGWGGVSVDDRTGDVYAATGNSQGTAREDAGYGEAVVRLTARLTVEQYNQPLMPPFEIGDRDFGTTPVLLNAHGCPAQLVAINKDGELLLYDRDHISAGPRQRVWVAKNSPGAPIPLIGLPAFDPATRTLVLISPSTPPTPGLRAGIQALTLKSNCQLAVRWWQPFGTLAGSSPTIANGVVYLGASNGFVLAYRLRDGRQLWSWRPSHHAIFAAPAVDHRTFIAAGWSGDVWAFRLGR
jgi:hypothetical protein